MSDDSPLVRLIQSEAIEAEACWQAEERCGRCLFCFAHRAIVQMDLPFEPRTEPITIDRFRRP